MQMKRKQAGRDKALVFHGRGLVFWPYSGPCVIGQKSDSLLGWLWAATCFSKYSQSIFNILYLQKYITLLISSKKSPHSIL